MLTASDARPSSFTGSVATGCRIMAACAPRIARPLLELGGKSAMIVFDGCDVENALQVQMSRRFYIQMQRFCELTTICTVCSG